MKERADLNLNATKIAFSITAAAERPSVGIRVMNGRYYNQMVISRDRLSGFVSTYVFISSLDQVQYR